MQGDGGRSCRLQSRTACHDRELPWRGVGTIRKPPWVGPARAAGSGTMLCLVRSTRAKYLPWAVLFKVPQASKWTLLAQRGDTSAVVLSAEILETDFPDLH